MNFIDQHLMTWKNLWNTGLALLAGSFAGSGVDLIWDENDWGGLIFIIIAFWLIHRHYKGKKASVES